MPGGGERGRRRDGESREQSIAQFMAEISIPTGSPPFYRHPRSPGGHRNSRTSPTP
ncbi:MAG: hypothetical protein ACI9MC_003686, partial [Kiritimatiellia bacterium]